MDMSAASDLLARKALERAGLAAGAPARIMDLPVMLAVLSVKQAAGFTATRMREGNPPENAGDEPTRMAAIFAPEAAPASIRTSLSRGLAGSFNAAVATRLSTGANDESDVYSGI